MYVSMEETITLILGGKVYNKEDFILKNIALKDLRFLEEIDILNPKPKKLPIGDKYILIKELPLSTIDKLSKALIKLMRQFKIIKSISIPDSIKELNLNTDKFENTIKIIETLLQQKKFRKVFSRLLKMVMPEIGKRGFPTLRYIENTITLTEASQIIISIWSYNFAVDIDSKKKIQEIIKELIKI